MNPPRPTLPGTHRHHGRRAEEHRLLLRGPRAQTREAHGELRRPAELPPVLRRRARPPRHRPDLLRLAGAHRGPVGPPQVTATSLAVPRAALGFWRERLKENFVKVDPSVPRFGDEFLSFADPDGMRLEIVATGNPGGHAWEAGPVPRAYAVRGMHGATVSEEGYENTAKLLTETMGF